MKRTLLLTTALLLLTAYAGAQTPPPAPRAESSFGKTQLFQIVILTGSADGPEVLKGLPKNAEKAINDIRNFLPYKHYVLVDSALLRMGSDAGGSQTSLEGKVDAETIGFVARMSYREREAKLSVDHFELARLSAGRGPRALLETSFGLVRGETVVVGTSKLDGAGKALIVLVTAVPTS
jgi:hypothetical protein